FIVFLRPHVVSGSMGWNLLINFYMLNIVLAVFNMIPIPPLDGSRILRLFLPFEWKLRWDQLENWGLMLVMGFVYFGGTEFFIRPAINGAFHFVNWLIQVLPVSGA
ncbi:MAG: site-2 protease family protein, partial [Planctomycetota bacterium]|nr:site-2 protease family protein [Planctomycetota bacterium]